MTMTSAFCCLRYAPNAYKMTHRVEAPQASFTSPLFKENNRAYVDLQSPASEQRLAPVASIAQASLGSDPATRISTKDPQKAMSPRHTAVKALRMRRLQ